MVPRRSPLVVTLATSTLLLGSLACNSAADSATDTATNSAANAEVTPDSTPAAPVGSPAALDPALAGPIELSKAVPADVAALMVMRAPKSLFATATQFGWLGQADPDADQAMRAEVDAFLRDRVGVQLTSTSAVTVYYAASPERFGVILDGVEGQLIGPEHGRHGETVVRLLAGTDDLFTAHHGALLLMGTEPAIANMLDTLDGKLPALVDEPGELGALLTSQSAGASLAVVAELARLPNDIAGPAAQIGAERGYLGFGAGGLRMVASGTPEGMLATSKLVTQGLAEALAEVERNKAAMTQGDDILLGVAAITGAHMGKRLSAILQPKLDGGRLSIEIPLALGDATTITALLGVAAAVAVPALQKYMRRAKTAEAKVQLAKLYDATASYFSAEHINRGADLADMVPTHSCPNNGQLMGEAGITPPLSTNCNEGPGGRCVPSEAASDSGGGDYDVAMWIDNPVWAALDFQQDTGHFFHYNFIWANSGDGGYGSCQFTVQAFADLDDDGVFSTYERYGAGDISGVNAAIGLYIDNEVE
jgi:type IV pilus assembly protein PilA